MSTTNTLWIPPLSSKDQKRLNRQRGHRWQKAAKRTGFSDKTLWDWLQFLAIVAVPIAIAILSTRQSTDSIQIAQDQQQENALQTYIDRMSDLILHDHLSTSKPGDEVGHVAHARTLTILPHLNGARKGEIIQFLEEAGLLQTNSDGLSLVDLTGANLSGANLSLSLADANLSAADLSYADLSGADLRGANVTKKQLDKAQSLKGATMPDWSKHP